MRQHHVVGRLRLRRAGTVGEVEWPEFVVFLYDVLVGFAAPNARHGPAREVQADGVELAGRQLRGSVASPEAVQVAGDDGETGDFGVTDEVVDLAAFNPCTAEVTALYVGESARRPLLLRQSGRQVLRIGAL